MVDVIYGEGFEKGKGKIIGYGVYEVITFAPKGEEPTIVKRTISSAPMTETEAKSFQMAKEYDALNRNVPGKTYETFPIREKKSQ